MEKLIRPMIVMVIFVMSFTLARAMVARAWPDCAQGDLGNCTNISNRTSCYDCCNTSCPDNNPDGPTPTHSACADCCQKGGC